MCWWGWGWGVGGGVRWSGVHGRKVFFFIEYLTYTCCVVLNVSDTDIILTNLQPSFCFLFYNSQTTKNAEGHSVPKGIKLREIGRGRERERERERKRRDLKS
jgi:hypothetical protein